MRHTKTRSVFYYFIKEVNHTASFFLFTNLLNHIVGELNRFEVKVVCFFWGGDVGTYFVLIVTVEF